VAGTKQRAREVARARYQRQQARRAEARAKRRQRQQVIGAVAAVLVVVLGVVLLVRLTGGGSKTDASSTVPTTAATTAAAGTCGFVKAGTAAKDVGTPPSTGVPHTGSSQATITFGTGPLTATLDTAKAPCTVNSFSYLAGKKYFDGTSCHRLTTASIYVLQCGDPTGTGSGGPGYQFGEENLPTGAANNYPAGTLAMANAGSGTNGSQFFIVYKDTTLPASYTIFGKVTAGLPVVQAIAAGGVAGGGTDGKPVLPATIKSVVVKKVA
jgi:peptidyl-prolyl cis-trans isomerase B (cyclophilin B)